VRSVPGSTVFIMAEDLTRLVREIERITAAPYVPSLQVRHSSILPRLTGH
jgi:hypothetical protein